ncbi:MAG: hypothetical protein IT350_21030 [Deltaproteobacteria bacterium]|nr:hypothetical protein [Deltaproteobacteria bacterium]
MPKRWEWIVVFVLAVAAVSCVAGDDSSDGDASAKAGQLGEPSSNDDAAAPADVVGADIFDPVSPVAETRAGDVEGVVVDPRNMSPVEGAEVRLLFLDGTPADPTVITTGPDGAFNFAQVNELEYIIDVTHPTHQDTQLWTRVFENGTTQLANVWLVPKPLVVLGSVSGIIKDALTGFAIGGAALDFRAGINAPDTEAVVGSTTTNASGQFTISLEAGVYTAYVTALNRCDTAFSVYVLGARNTGSQNGTMTTALTQGQMRIVLSWGATPADLDSHLWAPHDGCESQNPFHLYFSTKSTHGCTSSFDLDLDDVTSFGPETTTVGSFDDPVSFTPYSFLVHDYSNLGSGFSQAMSNSQGLRVEVFTGNSGGSCDQLTFTMPPNTPATVWHVFEAEYDGTNWSVAPIPSMDSYCFQSTPNLVGPTC